MCQDFKILKTMFDKARNLSGGITPVFLRKLASEYNFCSRSQCVELEFISLPDLVSLEEVASEMNPEIAKFVLL
jgi:hypothetical protein